ncbi:MAG: hypothetical protein JSV04_02765, partial [Candidatus Heimdallarchaeota archaeon]
MRKVKALICCLFILTIFLFIPQFSHTIQARFESISAVPVSGKVIDTFDTNGRQGLTHNVSHLFSTDSSNQRIYIYDRYTDSVVTHFSTAFNPMGVAYDSGFLYVADDNSPTVNIHKLNVLGGEIQSFNTTFSSVTGLTWFDGDLWLSLPDSAEICRYELETATALAFKTTNLGNLWGLA